VLLPADAKERINEMMIVTSPALRTIISHMTIRRRTGLLTTCSLSAVVNPVPVNADRAWNRAASSLSPVNVKATVATRVITSDKLNTVSNVSIPTIGPTNSNSLPEPSLGALHHLS
jgi:hypothetical protein